MNPVSAFSRNGFDLKVELSRELDVPRTVRLAADHSEVAWTSNDWPRVSAYPRPKNSTHMRMWLSRTNPNCNHCREDPLAHNEGERIPVRRMSDTPARFLSCVADGGSAHDERRLQTK